MSIRICGDNTTASPAITSASDTDTGLQFGTNEVKVVNGNLDITDGNLKVASGHGIDFSADGNAAGMTSELLDDYEEGTWTGSWYSGQNGTGSLLGTSTGNYVKVGKLVHVNINRGGAGTGSTLSVAGLPYPVINDTLSGQTSDESSIYMGTNYSVVSYRSADGLYSRFVISYRTT